MKFHIAICDDEAPVTEYLSALVLEWAETHDQLIAVSTFDSAEAFLFAYDADNTADLLLLDIKMKRLDGLGLAKDLRAKDSNMQIVFITGIPDYIAEGYEVSALHYLLKPVSKEKLFEVLNKAIDLVEKDDDAIIIDTQNGQHKLFCSEIQYIEAFAHNTAVQTQNDVFMTRMSIGELEFMLTGRQKRESLRDKLSTHSPAAPFVCDWKNTFLQPHRSYLVNLKYVRSITRTDIIMDNGKSIPLSRRRFNDVNQAFIQYYTRHAY